MRSEKVNLAIAIMLFVLVAGNCFAQQTASEYVSKAWAAKGAGNLAETYRLVNECIEKFSKQADAQAQGMADFPAPGTEKNYQVMTDVATCYFIKGEALRDEGKTKEAITVLETVIEKYPFAYPFNSLGWFWSIKEKAQIMIARIKGEFFDPPNEVEEETTISLHDTGTEFPVNYAKYGTFIGVGTKKYQYKITDPIGLAKATGEAIYPNSTSLKFDPEFITIKKKLFRINHWVILNSRDLRTAFYKWAMAPEPQGVKLFYIADLLEKSGLIKHAIKAYYATFIHFPNTVGWTYWKTPWYVGKASLYRIQYLLKKHPELGLALEGASITIQNGYDNDIRNDIFIVNPGKLVKMPLWQKMLTRLNPCGTKRRCLKKVVKETGGEEVKLVKYDTGDWQLFVKGKPFVIKAITYAPTKVGEAPDNGSLQDWTFQDTNENGLIDGPFEAWVDKNNNNQQDSNEPTVGDFQLLKEMGVNAIRLYKQPFELNTELIGQMYEKYGIYIIIGDFLGKYAIGSGASWEEGTDYDNPIHKKNMLASVREMVERFKDKPYVLMWLLGNENVYGVACNADKKPESFFTFANEAALLIKSLDPKKRPVALASGDTLHLDLFAKYCPDIDVYGGNSYRGKHGMVGFWDDVKRVADRPAMLTEYGAPSYGKAYSYEEAEDYQAQYHRAVWMDLMCNSAGFGAGTAIGAVAFEWLDEWWKAYEPAYHDRDRLSAGPFLDGYFYEEWFGLCSQGDGKHSPFMRQLKKVYHTYKELWNDN